MRSIMLILTSFICLLLNSLDSDGAAPGPTYVFETDLFILSLSEVPVGNIPSELPPDITFKQRPPTNEEILLMYAQKGHPAARYIISTQEFYWWYSGTIEPSSGNRKEEIQIPQDLLMILKSDAGLAAAQLILAFSDARSVYPEQKMSTYQDIYIDWPFASCQVFVAFKRESLNPNNIIGLLLVLDDEKGRIP